MNDEDVRAVVSGATVILPLLNGITSEEILARAYGPLTLAPDGKTSMLQDVEAGRKTEVEIFAGTVVELGRRHGVPTPVNDLLGRMLHALERMRAVRT